MVGLGASSCTAPPPSCNAPHPRTTRPSPPSQLWLPLQISFASAQIGRMSRPPGHSFPPVARPLSRREITATAQRCFEERLFSQQNRDRSSYPTSRLAQPFPARIQGLSGRQQEVGSRCRSILSAIYASPLTFCRTRRPVNSCDIVAVEPCQSSALLRDFIFGSPTASYAAGLPVSLALLGSFTFQGTETRQRRFWRGLQRLAFLILQLGSFPGIPPSTSTVSFGDASRRLS